MALETRNQLAPASLGLTISRVDFKLCYRIVADKSIKARVLLKS